MTKEELEKSLDFVNEERERLQYDIDNLTYQLAKKNDNWNELKEFILNHYIVGHKVQNSSLDMIINKMKELEND